MSKESKLSSLTKWVKVRLTFIEDTLATNPEDKELHDRFISSKAPDGSERKLENDSLEVREKMGTTIFLRDPKTGQFWMGNHMLKGFLKAAGEVFRVTEEEPEVAEEKKPEENGKDKKPKKVSKQWGNITGKINQLVKVYPKQMFINSPGDKPTTAPDSILQRSLRAQTQQGPRVALAKSEAVQAGSYLDATIMLIGDKPVTMAMIKECLDYGLVHGLGQWRNAGYGAFTYEILEEGEGLPEEARAFLKA